MILERLAKRGSKLAAAVLDAYNPDQPRDERGRWGDGGPGSGASTPEEHAASARYHRNSANEHEFRGEREAAAAHREAATAHEEASTNRSKTGVKGRMAIVGQAMARQLSSTANAESAKTGRNTDTLRTTMTELPSIKEAKVSQLAPHASLPVGNAKPTRMASDPNARTQELPAVSGTGVTQYSRQDRVQAASSAAGQWASRALRIPSVEKVRSSIEAVRSRMAENKARGQMSVFQKTSVKGVLEKLGRGKEET